MSQAPPINLADAKARHALRVLPDTVRVQASTPAFTGLTADREDGSRVLLTTFTLKASAPNRIRRAWWARAVASLTGSCPSCGAASGLASVGQIDLVHASHCRAGNDDLLREYATPESLAFVHQVAVRNG